jgi:competence protein ComEC
LAAVCWFAGGELIARNRQMAVILMIATALLLLLTLVAVKWSLRIAIVPLAAVWMAIGCWCAQIQPVPPTQQALAAYADGLSRQVRGRVMRIRELPLQQDLSDRDKEAGWWPEKEADEEASTIGPLSVDLQVGSIEEVTPDTSQMVPMMGGVRMNVIADKPLGKNRASVTVPKKAFPSLECGDLVEAPMRLKLAERYRDPGAWQYADYLLAEGIGAHASVRNSKITLLNETDTARPTRIDRAAQLQCSIYAAQSWASERMLGYVHSRPNRGLPRVLRLNPDDAGMLNAMLFGDRAGLNKNQRVGLSALDRSISSLSPECM